MNGLSFSEVEASLADAARSYLLAEPNDRISEDENLCAVCKWLARWRWTRCGCGKGPGLKASHLGKRFSSLKAAAPSVLLIERLFDSMFIGRTLGLPARCKLPNGFPFNFSKATYGA